MISDAIRDAMALARDVQVKSVGSDEAGVRYRIAFDVVLDRETWSALSDEAGKRRQRGKSLLRCYVAMAKRRPAAPCNAAYSMRLIG